MQHCGLAANQVWKKKVTMTNLGVHFLWFSGVKNQRIYPITVRGQNLLLVGDYIPQKTLLPKIGLDNGHFRPTQQQNTMIQNPNNKNCILCKKKHIQWYCIFFMNPILGLPIYQRQLPTV
jgi:hypothetical protein